MGSGSQGGTQGGGENGYSSQFGGGSSYQKMKAYLEQVVQKAKAEVKKSSTPLVQGGKSADPQTEREAERQSLLQLKDLEATIGLSEKDLSMLMKASGKEIAEKAARDGKADTDPKTGFPSAKKHEWTTNGNPNSEITYRLDTLRAIDLGNNRKQFWSCFEPRMVAWGYGPLILGAGAHAESLKLARACRANCPLYDGLRFFPRNFWEVIEYWLPENQVSYNNYGINRLRPQDQSNFGRRMTRQSLLRQKKQYEQGIIDAIDQKKAIDKKLLNISKLDRSQPRFGQAHWGGFDPDYQETGQVHGYRSRGGWRWYEELKPDDIHGGYLLDKEPKCIFNVFPRGRNERDIISMWSEYRQAAWYWTLPEFTMKLDDPNLDPPIPQTGSNESRTVYLTRALYGDRLGKPIPQVAKEDPPFWKTGFATADRAARWKRYQDLKDVGIQPKQDDKIREVNFFSGYELLPFPPNSTTFGPVLSNAAIAARRAFYLFSLPTFFDKIKEDQKHRMVYYTVLWSKKNQEVDKMQRMSPLDGGDDNSGSPSECYRSQRISTILQDDWDKKNFPPDLPDYQDKQFGDVNTMMWNKHVSCTCAEFGIQAGCIKMDLKDERLPQQEQKSRADGDWRYAEFEVPLCNWPEGILPSAFVNMYTFPACLFGLPPDGLRKQYKGLQDADDELPDS